MLIIGCGNRQRSDDAAGILVAERLRKLGLEADTRLGEAAELIEAWNGADDVIVVDAVVTGAPVGTVQAWDGHQPLTKVRAGASTHCLGVAEAIELARVLDRLPKRLRVYGIEGRRFEPGAQISPEVQRAVEEVVRRIIADLNAPPDSGRPSLHNTAFTESGDLQTMRKLSVDQR
jgi:hydrogenase maturation protease